MIKIRYIWPLGLDSHKEAEMAIDQALQLGDVMTSLWGMRHLAFYLAEDIGPDSRPVLDGQIFL